MAEFCNQCAAELGIETGDFAGFTSEERWKHGMCRVVLCEGCGHTVVDPKGNCVSPHCLKKHGKIVTTKEKIPPSEEA